VLRQKWSRGEIEPRPAAMRPCLIGMEALCVGAHHPNRKLQVHGHGARLLPSMCARIMFVGSDRPLSSPLARVIEEVVNAWRSTMASPPQRREQGAEAREHRAATLAEFFLMSIIENADYVYRLLDEERFPGLDPPRPA
jgi:hypothetical protein